MSEKNIERTTIYLPADLKILSDKKVPNFSAFVRDSLAFYLEVGSDEKKINEQIEDRYKEIAVLQARLKDLADEKIVSQEKEMVSDKQSQLNDALDYIKSKSEIDGVIYVEKQAKAKKEAISWLQKKGFVKSEAVYMINYRRLPK